LCPGTIECCKLEVIEVTSRASAQRKNKGKYPTVQKVARGHQFDYIATADYRGGLEMLFAEVARGVEGGGSTKVATDLEKLRVVMKDSLDRTRKKLEIRKKKMGKFTVYGLLIDGPYAFRFIFAYSSIGPFTSLYRYRMENHGDKIPCR
jgi:hypothetical protein